MENIRTEIEEFFKSIVEKLSEFVLLLA